MSLSVSLLILEITVYWLIEMFTLLTHRGWVTQICIGNLTIIGWDNGLSPGRRQAIFWTNAGILLISPLGTNFSKILIEIPKFSFKKMCLKVSTAKWCPFCLGLNVLRLWYSQMTLVLFTRDVMLGKLCRITWKIPISWTLLMFTGYVIIVPSWKKACDWEAGHIVL